MKLCMIGTGYVGLVSGVCFADLGNDVICVDKDDNKINNLNCGVTDCRYWIENSKSKNCCLNVLKDADYDEEKITLTLKYRKPKEVGKGKVDVVEDKEIPYSEIKKALVAIKF